MKQLISSILAITIILTGTLTMAQAREQGTIEYVFTGDHAMSAGYAEGELTLRAEDGDYALYWADGSGVLPDMYPITVLAVSSGRGSYSFRERVAVPGGADRIAAFRGKESAALSSAAAVYILPEYKRFPGAERLYRCEVLSDIHIDCQDGGENVYYTNASKNFKRALNVAQERGADFVITAGDHITNASGATLEWLEYQRVIAASDYDGPIYEAIGNHEMRYSEYSGCDPCCGVEEFMAATGLDGTAAAMSARKPYYELTEPVSGDHFIFAALEKNYSPNEYDEFSDEQIEWLGGLLAKYSGDGHRIFLIQHSLINAYGAGDNTADPAYGGALTATREYPNNLRFKELMERYKEVVWLSGHTHLDLRDELNYSDENGNSCLMFHVPSTAGTTRIAYDPDGKSYLDRTFYDEATQGYILDAYDGCAVLRGVNFYDDRYYPAYTYIIGDTPEGTQPATEPTQEPTASPTQEPTQEPTDAPTQTPTQEPTQEPTGEPLPAFVYGDTDGDGELSIIDATCIQRHLAGFEQLTGERLRAGRVDGEDVLNIIDATLIQRKLAGIIDSFPVERTPASTGAADVSASAGAELAAYYQYASYPEYSALRRACSGGDTAAVTAALESFRALRGRVKLTTVYFSDSKGMGHPYAYAWNHSGGKYTEPYPGQKTTYVRTNSLGQQVYAVTVDSARYDSVIFSSGDKKTADIRLAPQSGRVYYPVSDSSPYTVSFGVYEKLWRDEEGDEATVYFTDTLSWGTPYIYYWNSGANNGWPGVKMTFVRKSSAGKNIYKAVVPADAKVIFSNGDSKQTVDVPAVADGFGYYPFSENGEGKWTVTEYKYQ